MIGRRFWWTRRLRRAESSTIAWRLDMPRDRENQESAFEFFQMACGKQWMQRSLEWGNAAPRMSVLNEPTVAERHGWAPVLAATVKTAKLEPRDPVWPGMDLQLRVAISAVLLGQKTAKVAWDGSRLTGSGA